MTGFSRSMARVREDQVTPATWTLLNRVNDRVNEDIVPETDLENYGRADYWTIPTDGYGDCEDYALTKRREMIADGLPELALRIAVVIAPDGGRHAELTVSTDKGDYVLDNLRARIVPWTAAGYRLIEHQAANNPWNWVEIQPQGMAPSYGVAENHLTAAPKLRPDLSQVAMVNRSPLKEPTPKIGILVEGVGLVGSRVTAAPQCPLGASRTLLSHLKKSTVLLVQ